MTKTTFSAGTLQEIWTKLNSKWRGDAADAFYTEYIIQMQECAEQFAVSCSNLSNETKAISAELVSIEQSLNE